MVRTFCGGKVVLLGLTLVGVMVATGCSHAQAGAAEGPLTPAGNAAAATPTSAENAPATQITAAQPVEIEKGTALHVRLDQALSSVSAAAGDSFDGRLTQAVLVNGQVAVPEGTRVQGTVEAADSAGHFAGQSRLVLQLTSLEMGGEPVSLGTQSITRLSAARGKRSGETIGGGAAVGALIGALAGHGKGAAIGGVAGAGAGTVVEAATKPPEVEIAAETTLLFHLSGPIQVVPSGQ